MQATHRGRIFFFLVRRKLIAEQSWGREKRNARFPRPLDPDLLYLVGSLSQAGRVSDDDREPADIQ